MNTLTQTQISAYERCKRQYYLKYIRRLVWPVETADRRKVREGDDFHLLMRQLIMGLPRESLIIPDDDKNIAHWLDVFQREQPLGKPYRVFAEKEVSLLFADLLWLGKFDALALDADRLTIFDWKTGTIPPDRMHYARLPQTRLYRFLALSCASRLTGSGRHRLPAENVEMVYWFPQYPDQTVRLPYSDREYQEDMTWLKMLAREMTSDDEKDYPQTEKQRLCSFCEYRTHCYPETALQPAAADLSGEDLIPDDIWQEDLFSMEIPADSDREETTF